jgi:single-strand DNA-binding protein
MRNPGPTKVDQHNHSRDNLTTKGELPSLLQMSLDRKGNEMPKSVNKVILVGNVGKDPEVRYSQSGTPVANFSVATNERFKDRNGGWQDRTEWHNIVAWQRLAEIVGEYVAKGSKVYVEGKLQTTSWEDRQSGDRKYRTQVVARDLVLLGSVTNGTSDPGQAARTSDSPSEAIEPAPALEGIPF